MARKYEFDYDLIVIGSGAGGSAAATITAREGLKVAIIEDNVWGGESPNWGDVPAKALLHAANLYDEAKHGARFGLRSATLGYNYPSIRTWKDLAIKRTGAGGNRKYYDNQDVDTYSGPAHFLSPNEISVNRRHLSAGNFLIATGCRYVAPKIPGLDKIEYFTPHTILETLRPPKTLLIIGGNEDGVEIAQLMATFGTKVYIVEESDHLLSEYDNEVCDLIERVMTEQKGVTILTQAKVALVEKEGLGKKVIVSRGGVDKSLRVDEILVAIDRKPAVDMGLENADVKYSEAGIKVNEHLQTSTKHIYAAGSVLGTNSATHTAIMESHVVASNLTNLAKVSPDYHAIPNLIFTNPGIATVGKSEKHCIRKRLGYKKAVAPLSIIGRSNTSDFRDGFVKIITDKRGVVKGATVVAPHAAEIIHELVLAVNCRLTAADLATTPHAFLSWSEAVRVAAANLILGK